MRACDNPFRSDRVLSVRYRFLNGDDWESILGRLDELQYRAAIVGLEGAGKTTLHEELAERLKSQGQSVCWLRLNRENRHLASRLIEQAFVDVTTEDCLFVDGAEQLGFWRWQRLKRRAASLAGLVINTHTPGWLPTLVQCETTSELLHEVTGELTPDPPSTALLDRLFDQHDGNLRLCLRSLYDLKAAEAEA